MTTNHLEARLLQARRDLILKAAINTIVEQGFARTTIKQIAKRAGVADGTIYNYFKNKNALLMAIVEQLTEAERRERTLSTGKKVPLEGFVTGYVNHHMVEVNQNIQALKVILPETITNREIADVLYKEFYQPAIDRTEDYFSQWMADNEMTAADPGITARLFAAPILGLLLLRFMGDEHVPAHWSAYGDALADMFLNAFTPKQDGRLSTTDREIDHDPETPYQYYDA